MLGTITTDKKGKPKLDATTRVSSFQPTQEVADFTNLLKKDYQIGEQIQSTPYEEFNDFTFLDRMSEDQKAWNSYSPKESGEPDEAWRWLGVRPIVRQKILGIASHVIAAMSKPSVFAQNDLDEEDKEAERVMGTMLEYNIRNSEYPLSFLFGVLDAMINPVAYFDLSYNNAHQSIKVKGAEGYKRTKVIDEELSGFQIGVTPPDEILITNVNEFNLQKQRAIMRRKIVDYDYLEAKYSDHENFQYVTPGVKSFYDPGGKLFYDQDDDNYATMGEEVTYYNRREDLEIPYVNGVYMGDTDITDNRIKHRDNRNRPKYHYVKFGYHPINSRFYFYKSLAFELGPDYHLLNEMNRLVMDRTFMEVMPSLGVFGSATRIDKSVRMPGAITAFNSDTKVEPLIRPSNLNAGYQAIAETEKSMRESSQDEVRGGVSGSGDKTAFEISRMEENARIQLGIFGTMVGEAVRDSGNLMIDIIINNQTVGEVMEVLAGQPRMNFKTFLLSDQVEDGKTVTKKVIFDKDMIGKKFTDKQRLKASYKMIDEEGGLDSNVSIARVNPYFFSRLSFKCFVEPEREWPVNKSFQKILNLEAYDRMIENPYIKGKEVTRDFLVNTFSRKDPDKYMKKEEEMEQQVEQAGGGKSSRLVQGLTNAKALNQMGQKSI